MRSSEYEANKTNRIDVRIKTNQNRTEFIKPKRRIRLSQIRSIHVYELALKIGTLWEACVSIARCYILGCTVYSDLLSIYIVNKQPERD